MSRVVALVITVILPVSVSASLLWPQSKMSSFVFNVHCHTQRKMFPLAQQHLRAAAKPLTIQRADMQDSSRAKEQPEGEYPGTMTVAGKAGPNLTGRAAFAGSMLPERQSRLGFTNSPPNRFRALEHLLTKIILLACVHVFLTGNVAAEMRCVVVTLVLLLGVSEVLSGPVTSLPSAMLTHITPSVSQFAAKSSSTRQILVSKTSGAGQSSVHLDQRIAGTRSVASTATILVDESVTQQPSTGPKTEKKLVQQTTPSMVDSEARQGSCESGWLEFAENEHCYKFFQNARTFNRAKKECFYQGAYLVTISDKKENHFVWNIDRKYTSGSGERSVWLGFERMSSDSRLHPVDGSPLDYEMWAPGEPDSNGACVKMIRKAWWEDTSCLDQLAFICERDAPPAPPYPRSVELAVLIGIPVTCAFVMLSVVTVLFVRSVRDSEGTHFGYGKKRDRATLHSCLALHFAANGHIGPQSAAPSELELGPVRNSRRKSSVDFRRGSAPPEITITPDTPELPIRQEANVFASTGSLDQEPSRVQSTTSLDHLVSKSYFKPKSRRMRSLRKSEAVVSGKEGRFRKKAQE